MAADFCHFVRRRELMLLMPMHPVEAIVDISVIAFGGRWWPRHHIATMARPSHSGVRRSGALSSREMVGCEARSAPLSGKRQQASLRAGSWRG